MKSAGLLASPEGLSESQRTALINLLGDDDPAVYRTVREKFLSFGPQAADWPGGPQAADRPAGPQPAQRPGPGEPAGGAWR